MRNSTSRRSPSVLLLAVVSVVALFGLAACDTGVLLMNGRVTTQNGTRAPGVEVELYSDEATQAASTTTDAFGEYAFRASSGIADGEYRVRVAGGWWPSGADWADAQVVTIGNGGPVAVVDATLAPAVATVEGAIVDAERAAVANAVVVLIDAETGAVVATATSAGDGTFAAELLRSGSFRIQLAQVDHPLVVVGGATPEVFYVSTGTTRVGTVDVTNGEILPVPTYKAVSSGYSHSCGIRTDDTVVCWGNVLVRDAPSGAFTAISSGNFFACGIRADATLACWGSNSSGQAAPPAGTYTSVSAGPDHACATATDDTIACWGLDNRGQSDPPAGSFKSVEAGYYNTCALRLDGTIACWGLGNWGQSTPPSGTFEFMSVGAEWGCAMRADKTVACWGAPNFGTLVPPAGDFTEIHAGAYFACGLLTDESLTCWGENDQQQLAAPTGKFREVTPGLRHACAIAVDGTMACWGQRSSGETTPPRF